MERKIGSTLIERLVMIAALMGIMMPALQKAGTLGQNVNGYVEAPPRSGTFPLARRQDQQTDPLKKEMYHAL